MLTRLWILLLALALGASVAAAPLLEAELGSRDNDAAREILERDAQTLSHALSIDAHRRTDALSAAAAHEEIRAALAAASANREIDTDALSTALRETAGEDADRLFAVRADGSLVVDAAGGPEDDVELGELSVVGAALAGETTNGVIELGDVLLSVVAHPVLEDGRLVGALIHARALDAKFAASLLDLAPGATVALHRDSALLGVAAPEGRGIDEALLSRAVSAQSGAVVDLGKHAIGVRALLAGAAAEAGVGIVAARPAPARVSLGDVLDSAREKHLGAILWPLVIGVALLGTLVGWLFFALDVARVRKSVEATLPRVVPSTPSPGVSVLQSASAAPEPAPEPAAPAAPAEAPTSSPEPATQDEYADAPTLSLERLDESERTTRPDEARSTEPPPAAPAPEPEPEPEPEPATIPERIVPPSLEPRASWAPSDEPEAKPEPILTPPAPKPAMPTPPAFVPKAAPPPFDPDGFDDDGATTVAEIPRELIAQVQEQKAPEIDPELAHFHEVYEQFLEMKRRLGEPTAGLTYERFETTLKKNRDAIIEKHGVSTVRFTVYDKNGKAALRATPVK